MPQPTLTDVHVDALLTNLSVAYMQNAGIFIATKVFPVVPVEKKSDKYYVYTKNDWFRDEAQRRSDTQESAGSGYTLGTDSYSCDVWAIHKDIGDQMRSNADAQINPDRDATEFVTSRMLLRMERQWAADFFTTGVWNGGTDLTGVASGPTANQFIQWNDDTSSDPIGDIEKGKRSILISTGFMPNTLILGYDVFIELQSHPDIVDRYKYTSSQVVTADLLGKLFGVDRVLVTSSVYATNKEGETAAYSFVHGKAALLCYVAPNPGMLAPSAGYTFLWRGVSAGLNQPVSIRRFRIEPKRCDRIEGEVAFDNKIVGADLGIFYTSAVA